MAKIIDFQVAKQRILVKRMSVDELIGNLDILKILNGNKKLSNVLK